MSEEERRLFTAADSHGREVRLQLQQKIIERDGKLSLSELCSWAEMEAQTAFMAGARFLTKPTGKEGE